MSTQVSRKRSLVEAAAWLCLVAAVAAVPALLFHGCSDPVKVADELVIKDPRLAWFLSLWRVAAIRCDATPTFITMLRPPTEVVGSKEKYYGGDAGNIDRTAAWTNLMLHTERGTRQSPRVFIRYHDLLSNWTTSVFRAGEELDIYAVQSANAEQMRQVQDDCIRNLVALQESVGMSSVTDGEFRRRGWSAGFIDSVQGFGMREGTLGFRDERGEKGVLPSPYARERLSRKHGIATDEFRFLKSVVKTGIAKTTIPSPDVMHFFLGPQSFDTSAYPDTESYYADLVRIYHEEIRDLVALGCDYIQLDNTALPCNCDEHVRADVRGHAVALQGVHRRLHGPRDGEGHGGREQHAGGAPEIAGAIAGEIRQETLEGRHRASIDPPPPRPGSGLTLRHFRPGVTYGAARRNVGGGPSR